MTRKEISTVNGSKLSLYLFYYNISNFLEKV